MDASWQTFLANRQQEMDEAQTFEEEVQIYCSMLNFILAVETPLEVIEVVRKSFNNHIWNIAAGRLLLNQKMRYADEKVRQG